jgi:acyl-CoA thioester hydrolase
MAAEREAPVPVADRPGRATGAPGWTVTARGAVFAWEVDTVGHFTVAYYAERFADAALALLDRLGLGPAAMARTGRGCLTTDGHVRYLRELRAGDVLHVESAVIGVEPAGLRLGHKLYDSETGALCATFAQGTAHGSLDGGPPEPLPDEARRAAAARVVAWDGPPRDARPQPRGDGGFWEAARDTVKPGEMDVSGRSAPTFHVHRFSAAALQTFAALGMTPAYQRDEGRGFSTFEFQLAGGGPRLLPGDLVTVRTAVLHVGTTSMRVFHRLVREADGGVVATLDQLGVNLDTAARRPAPWPDHIRERARALLARVTLDPPGA